MFTVKNTARSYLKQIVGSSSKTNVATIRKSAGSITVQYKSARSISDGQKVVNNDDEGSHVSFSNTISFSSPESDFSTSHILIKSQYTDLDYEHTKDTQHVEDQYSSESDFSGTLSFASPESDFTSSTMTIQEGETTQDNVHETKMAKDTFFQNLEQKPDQQDKVAYSLSFASAEGELTNPQLTAMLDERQKKQLENSTLLADLSIHENANQLSSMVNRRDLDLSEETKKIDAVHLKEIEDVNSEYQELRAHANLLSHEDPLPTNMEEATVANDDRAIVITEAVLPFKIVNVNSAWEGLCGYTKDECNGQTLKCIQGPETNQAAVTALMSQLLRGEEAGTVLVNYRKDGSKFLNRLRVGTLRDDNNAVTHFVGVLKEVKEMTDHFNGASRIMVQD